MQTILNFLSDLKQNNNRDWFQKNKDKYENAKSMFFELVDILIMKINEFDPSIGVLPAKDCVFRIYKDVRFSKDKTPYKTNMGAYIARGGRKTNLAGYYLQIEPGASFAGGGIYRPHPDILKAVRSEISENAASFKSILNKPAFKTVFPEFYGEKLKTAPHGFDKNHPDIDLLRNKSYTVIKSLSDKDLTDSSFLEKLIEIFKIQKPFNDFLNACISQV